MTETPKELAARLAASAAQQRARNKKAQPSHLSQKELAVAVRTALQLIADKKEYRADGNK